MKSLSNNLYAVKTMWKLCRSRLIFVAIQSLLSYFEWVFYSAFFMRYVIGAIEREKNFSEILLFIGITILFFASAAVFNNYVDNVAIPLTDKVFYQKFYNIIYRKAANVELRCFEDADFYNRYTLATKDAADNMTGIVKNFFGVIFGGLAAVIVFAVMYGLDHLAMLFVLAPILGNFVFGSLHNKILYRIYKESIPANRKTEYINRVIHLSDYAKEIRLSKVFGLLKHKYNEAVEEAIKVSDRYAKKAFVAYWFKVYLTFTVIFQGVLIYGVYRTAVSKSMVLADLAILSSVMVAATWILIFFTADLMECNKKALLVENIRSFLEYKEEIPEDMDGILPDKRIDSIEFRKVTFSYKIDQEPVIRKLSFTIKENTAVALVGHNGAGKSTIIKLLFRMYDPTEGEILVNGRNIKEYNLRAYRKLFAAAFQDYKIFAMSVRENVLMRKAKIEDPEEEILVKRALKKAGIYDKIASLPKGLDTMLTKEFDEEGVILSGGQFQKIVVARAFAHDTPIKIFDEPSSALDPIAECELYDSIIEDSKDKTMIFISHRLSSVRNADMVYMLENGTIIEEGTHQELMKRDGAYADMYQKQAQNYLALT